MSPDEFSSLQDEVTNALSDVLAKYEKSFITKWVAIVEVVEVEDGERGLWSLASGNMKTWESKGMLHHAIDMEVAKNIVDAIKEEEDD